MRDERHDSHIRNIKDHIDHHFHLNFGPTLIIVITMFITIIIDMMIKMMTSRMIGGIEGIEEICASLGLGKVPLLNAENRLDKIRFISTGCFFFTGTPLKSSKYKRVNLGKVRCI